MTHINLDYLDLMSDGDADMKKMMLDILFEEMPVELKKMQTLVSAKNWEELGQVSHKMKSTLAFVGNETMTKTNKTLELICKSGESVEKSAALVTILTDYYQKVLPELNEVYEKL